MFYPFPRMLTLPDAETSQSIPPPLPCAGQYITLAENPSKDVHFAPRHYTISCRPSDAKDRLRITVKRLRGPAASIEDGIMSSYVNQLKAGDVVRPARAPPARHSLLRARNGGSLRSAAPPGAWGGRGTRRRG